MTYRIPDADLVDYNGKSSAEFNKAIERKAEELGVEL